MPEAAEDALAVPADRIARLPTLAVPTLLAAAVLLAACAKGASTAAAPATPTTVTGTDVPEVLTRPTAIPSDLPLCRYPPHIATPAWLPRDLPFPVGTYTYQVLPDSAGYHRALLAIPTTLDKLARFVEVQWPQAGWVLGEGESEAGEAEQQFVKAPAVGVFKAVSEYCSPGFSRMLLVYTEQSALPGFPTP